MDPGERLREGEEAARNGHFEEALRHFIWFHEHALQHNQAYYGVRLSFALADWVALGEAFPPALQALRDICDTKIARLRGGDGDRETFTDVAVINERLRRSDTTYELFLYLRANSPQLAHECADRAMDAIVEARDFQLARMYLSDPANAVIRCGETLNLNVDTWKNYDHGSEIVDAFVDLFIAQVRQFVQILAGVGEFALAETLRMNAVESVTSPVVRETVRLSLYPAT